MNVTATEMPRNAISVEDLTRTFSPATRALADATFDIEAGTSTAIVGRSGSGKTTLLSLLGLLDQPTSGRYTLFGEDMTRADDTMRTRARRQHIGFVFQAFHLIPHLTAQENVQFPLDIDRVSRRESSARAMASLRAVGLNDRAQNFPGQMSGGEQQRVAIARAIVREPLLLLCDEPTGNLDSQTATEIINVLRDYHAKGNTLVIVTHDIKVAATCDRGLTVEDGRVEADR